LSGKTSKTPRPKIFSRFVMVAWRYASVTALMVKSGARTRYRPGVDWNNAWKSGGVEGKDELVINYSQERSLNKQISVTLNRGQ
jgi:hypothetical protein